MIVCRGTIIDVPSAVTSSSYGRALTPVRSLIARTVARCPTARSTLRPVIFKGSGWYVTDYGKGRGNNGFGTDKSDGKDDEKKESSAKESSDSSKAGDSKAESKSTSTSAKTD